MNLEYLALIESCLSDLRETGPDNGQSEEDYQTLLDEIKQGYDVWSLVNAVAMSDINDRHHDLSYFLSRWFCQTYPDQPIYTKEEKNELDDDDEVMLWRQVIQYVLVGDLPSAQQTLTHVIQGLKLDVDEWRQTTASVHLGQFDDIPDDVSPFILIQALLEAAPEFSVAARADGSWATWQKACSRWTDAELYLANFGEYALRVLRIMSGNDTEMERACSSWQHMLVACALYARDPTTGIGIGTSVGSSGIRTACGIASAAFEAPSEVAGGALVDAAFGNFEEVIIRLKATLPTPWFAAHLCDVLIQANKIADALIDDDSAIGHVGLNVNHGSHPEIAKITLREACFVQYIESLRSAHHIQACWRLVIDYCQACPLRGPKLLVNHLHQVPLTDARTAEKLLQVCKKRGLNKLYTHTCERMATPRTHTTSPSSPSSPSSKASSSLPLGTSLMWFARAKRYDKCVEVARNAVKRAERGGPLSAGARDLEGVSYAIGACSDAQVTRALDYAVLYYTMQEARATIQHSAGDDDRAFAVIEFVNAIKALIAHGGAHHEFWAVIAYEAAKVLHLYPNAAHQFPRSVLLDLVGTLELVSGPYAPAELVDSLCIRIANEIAMNNSHLESESSQRSNQVGSFQQDMVEPCDNETLISKVDQCRAALLQVLAKRINER